MELHSSVHIESTQLSVDPLERACSVPSFKPGDARYSIDLQDTQRWIGCGTRLRIQYIVLTCSVNTNERRVPGFKRVLNLAASRVKHESPYWHPSTGVPGVIFGCLALHGTFAVQRTSTRPRNLTHIRRHPIRNGNRRLRCVHQHYRPYVLAA